MNQADEEAQCVLVVVTGGTFDKSYDVAIEKFTFHDGSYVEKLISLAYIENANVQQIFLIDSLDMMRDHRAKLIATISASPIDRVVVVHGTSTLIETALLLEETFGMEKTIVLTGALKPIRYEQIEAACNFGSALTAARYLMRGVYVAMHGMVESPSKLRKIRESGRFEISSQA